MAKKNVKNEAVNQNEEKTTEVNTAETRPVRVKKELDRNMLVPVMNITNGTLIYKSKRTGLSYVWYEEGDIQEIELGELINMRASSPRFINEPWVLILDDEVIEYLNLKSLYERIIRPEDIERLFVKSPQKIIAELKKAPRGIKELVAIKAKERIKSGDLRIAQLRALEEALGTKLENDE